MMRLKHLCSARPSRSLVGVSPALIAPALPTELYVPLFTYRTGPFAGSGIPIANGMHDYLDMLNERDGGIGGVKIIVEECETGYDNKKGRRMLRAGQDEAPGRDHALFDRHHAAADPEGGGRQDPAPVDGLRPLGLGRRQHFPWIFNPPATYWDGAVDDRALHRRQGRRPRQAQGQDARLHLSSTAATARSRSRCSSSSPRTTASTSSSIRCRPARDAEPVERCGSTFAATVRTTDHVGLGRDEPDRRQGSRPRPTIPMDHFIGDLVVGQRGRRASGRRGRQGLSRRSTSMRSARTSR